MTKFVQPVTLTGQHATLAPLSMEHAAGLREAAADGELHRLWYTSVPSPEGVEAEIARRLALQDQDSMQPFTVLDADGRVAGMTTYMNIDGKNRRVEIGSTWYAKRVQRTALNTECKLMLLRHAFETVGCVAVEFRTNWLNHQSREAIARLGAKQDGVLRSQALTPEGVLRDTVVFSILAVEWPAVKRNLEYRLGKPR